MQFLHPTHKTPPSFERFLEENCKISAQLTKLRQGKFKMTHLKSLEKCLVTDKTLQKLRAR